MVYGVYLVAADQVRRHIGNLVFFGLEEIKAANGGEHGSQGLRHNFNATSVVRDLKAEGLWQPGTVEVTFAPLRNEPGEGVALEPDEMEKAAPPVTIGRVAMFVA
jgi:hypothetical protein